MVAEPEFISLAVRDFALPVPRTGSIEAQSGYGRAAEEGREIHLRVQRRRTAADPAYEREVVVSRDLERSGYRFRISGRIDGIFRHDPPRIEEIKTGFDIQELAGRLSGNPLDHPYSLQLLTYGYFFWLENSVVPALTLHLVSSRDGRSRDTACDLDLPAYENWLDMRLDELAREAGEARKRAGRRTKLASRLSFPFPQPRPGQIDLMQAVEEGILEGSPMLIQAPTGLGKTVGILHPVLKDALERGQRVVYGTPKNSQHGVVEDAVARFQEAGSRIRPLTITAKGKICFMDEPFCDPDYCGYARDYYTKLHEHAIPDLLAKKKSLTARVFQNLGKKYEVCPFELQFDAVPGADIVICDYNYVFAPRTSFGRVTMVEPYQVGKPNLVIDEFHNLPARSMDYYSPSLSSAVLESMREEMECVPARFRREAGELLDACIEVVAVCKPEGLLPVEIHPPLDLFVEQDAILRAFLSRYLESGVIIRHGDVIMRLCYSWAEFTSALAHACDEEREEFFTTFHAHPTGGIVRITCADASAMLKARYEAYAQVIGFSATVKPFEYYAELSGLDPATIRTVEVSSPFAQEHRKLLIIPQVSTKYADRERNYHKIADAIKRIAELRRGNYLAFFPSFSFVERVHALLQAPEGFAVLKQEREMRRSHIEDVLQHLREQRGPTIVLAVQGGMFSEGLDYPGEMAIGAFVIGPPLPNFDLERELMRGYYQRRYGAGFDYAYAIPAMARAVQAAGRVIRSETDRGLIVLMDSRFVQPGYSRSMPADWFETGAEELVSSAILNDVADFWRDATKTSPETQRFR